MFRRFKAKKVDKKYTGPVALKSLSRWESKESSDIQATDEQLLKLKSVQVVNETKCLSDFKMQPIEFTNMEERSGSRGTFGK